MYNMKNLFILVFLYSSLLLGQETNFKFKKPGPEDFAYSVCSFDEEANAVILNEEGKLNISNQIAVVYVKRRMKILNEKGKNEATINIRFYDGGDSIEKILGIKAHTINKTSDGIKVIEVNKNDFHTIDINKYWKEIRFTFPAVEEGSILEYTYNLSTKNLMYIDSWEFQHELPTERSYFSINNNSQMGFTTILQGSKLVKFAELKGKNVEKMTLLDIPSFNKIKHVYNTKDHIEKISFQNEYSANTWKGLVKDKLIELKGSRRMRAIRDMVGHIEKSNDEKVLLKNVAKYVKTHFGWDGYYGIWPRKNINQIIKEKEGSLAELNYLFYLLLNEMGVDSELMMLSSRSNGKMIVSFPYLGQFDHLINLVKFKDGSSIVMDASAINLNELNFYPLKLSNHYALLLNDNVDFVKVTTPISEYTFKHNYTLENNGYRFVKNAKWSGYFDDKSERGLSLFEPENLFGLEFDTQEEQKKEFKDGYYFSTIVAHGDMPEENILVLESPLLNLLKEIELEEETRDTMVEYDFPLYIKGTILLQVPNSYDVALPESKSYKVGNKAMFGQTYAQKKDRIHMNYYLLLAETVYDSKEYAELKSFVDSAIKASIEQIVLKKKN